MQHINLLTIVAFLTAAAIAASRILVATRPLWGKLPATVQVIAPLLVPALTTLAQELAGVKTGVDLTTVLIGCVLLAVPGLPSNRSAAKLEAGKPPTLSPSASDVAVSAVVVKKDSAFPPPSKPPSIGPMGGMLMLCLVVSLTSCSIFGSGGSFWPKVEKCAPSPASLVSQVADILIAGGDYEAALKQLALQDGGAAVICAVQAFVNSIGHKVGAAPDELSGEARGQVFLSKHPVSE